MPRDRARIWSAIAATFGRATIHPVTLAVMPVSLLLLYRAFGEMALLVAALVLPVVCLWIPANKAKVAALRRSAASGLMDHDGFAAVVERAFQEAEASGLRSAVFSIEIDDHNDFVDMYGHSGTEKIANTLGPRLASIVRDDDAVARTGEFSFAICLKPVRQLDLQACLQLTSRMQTALEEPIALDGITVYVTASIGFAQLQDASAPSAKDWRDRAGMALVEAQRNGAGSIRAFSKEIEKRSTAQAELRLDIASALTNGQIRPWFQPQISTDTGRVTGFEALARWLHPTKGLIPPGDFLNTVERSGLLERLAEVMIFQSLIAIKAWDKAGVHVPQVGVNFAGPELNNPKLADKIAWELDRFDLAPNRLAVEVLETVISNAPDDTVTRNIKKLGELGCKIDLDDFGTGHTSITSIRRFAVNRIKIDRSFVMKCDRDPEQQRIISAVLTMAERLNVETLAEGVETVGEHALLAQLGCNHVQGFGIARPMPFDQTLQWMQDHNAKLQSAEQIMGSKLR